LEGFKNNGVITPGVQHAHRLGALAGKNKSKCGHVQMEYLERNRVSVPRIADPGLSNQQRVNNARGPSPR
jgi:hypothetical protein